MSLIQYYLTERSLITKYFFSFFYKTSNAFLTFCFLVLVARWLGPQDYGEFAVLFALGNFLGLIATAGQHSLVLRTVSGFEACALAGRAKAYVRQGYTVIGCVTAAIIVFLVIGGFGLDLYGLETQWWLPLVSVALALPFAMAEYQSHTLRAVGSVHLALLPRDVLWRLIVLAIMGGLIAGGVLIDAIEAMLLTGAVLAGLIAAQVLLSRPLFQPPLIDQPRQGNLKQRIFDGRWLWVHIGASATLPHLSTVIVGAVLSTDNAGVFFAAQKTALLLSLPLIAANIIGGTLMAKAWSRGDRRELQRICNMVVVATFVPTLAGVVLFAAYGGWFLGLFDPSYEAYKSLLLVLSVGTFVNALCGPTGMLLVMTGNERIFVYLLVATQAAGLALMLALTVATGLYGTAVADAVGMIMWNLAVVVWARRNLGVDPTFVGMMFPPKHTSG